MNLLQSFMGCMYPGSIRTESIESMDHDYPDFRFQVANIDMQGNEVSAGELQLTDRDLIYFRPSRFPTRWPIGYIRRYGCSNNGNIFIFEAGRRCPTGEAIYAFRVSRGLDLVERLREKIEKFSRNDTNQRPKVPQSIHCDTLENKKDASTSTDNQAIDATNREMTEDRGQEDLQPLPGPWLSYASIDFDISKALSETKQAHAASRVR